MISCPHTPLCNLYLPTHTHRERERKTERESVREREIFSVTVRVEGDIKEK